MYVVNIEHKCLLGEPQSDNRETESPSPIPSRTRKPLNRILKYQALNDRRLQRALTQLERLQRQRRGDYVPLPQTFRSTVSSEPESVHFNTSGRIGDSEGR